MRTNARRPNSRLVGSRNRLHGPRSVVSSQGGGVAAFDLTSLVSAWHFEEATGVQRNDSYGSNHLTDASADVTQETGKVGTYCAGSLGTGGYLEKTDTASLSMGDIDFSIVSWVKLASVAANIYVWGKGDTSTNLPEYALRYDTGTSRIRFSGSNGALATWDLAADTLGLPVINTWYFVVCWHDASANTVNIQVNNGTVDSAVYSDGSYDSTTSLIVCGAYGSLGNPSYNGYIDEMSIWKRVLTAAERTSLYNGGTGRAYPFN